MIVDVTEEFPGSLFSMFWLFMLSHQSTLVFSSFLLNRRVKTWMFVHGRFRETAVSLVQATLSIKDSVVAPGVLFVAGVWALSCHPIGKTKKHPRERCFWFFVPVIG